VLSGGGTLLQNGTSTRSLMYYLAIIKTAKLFGKRVMLYANGIGPVSGALNRRLVKSVVNTVDVITLREKLSEADLRSIGVSKPDIIVTADPAFNLESISDEEARAIFVKEGIDLSRPLVGVSVRAWSKAYGGEDYIAKLAAACDKIIAGGREVVFLPMEYPRDIEISTKVMGKMSKKSYIIKSRYTPSQILGMVGLFDVMISMRLHSLIFAAIKNVPMSGIIYDPKVEYYIKELDMLEAGDVRNSELNSDKIAAQVDDIYNNMSVYKARLEKTADKMRSRAYQNEELLQGQLDIIRKEKKRNEK
jgi:polysaccharide pyruvyl transferase CsaB